MADLLDGIARCLDELGLPTYDPTGTAGDTFIETLAPEPAEAVGPWLYGAGEQDAHNGYDARSLQVRVHGTAGPRAFRRRAEVLYGALHGLADLELPDGTWLVLAVAQQTPASLGTDTSGRHEHTVNFPGSTWPTPPLTEPNRGYHPWPGPVGRLMPAGGCPRSLASTWQ